MWTDPWKYFHELWGWSWVWPLMIIYLMDFPVTLKQSPVFCGKLLNRNENSSRLHLELKACWASLIDIHRVSGAVPQSSSNEVITLIWNNHTAVMSVFQKLACVLSGCDTQLCPLVSAESACQNSPLCSGWKGRHTQTHRCRRTEATGGQLLLLLLQPPAKG